MFIVVIGTMSHSLKHIYSKVDCEEQKKVVFKLILDIMGIFHNFRES